MAGWGYVENNTRPMILKTGLVKLISLQECIERGKNATGDENFHIPRQYFCSMAEPWLLANCVSIIGIKILRIMSFVFYDCFLG